MHPVLRVISKGHSAATGFSLPLLGGVVGALFMANARNREYTTFVESSWGFEIAHHAVNLKFVANDIIMAIFFGLAMKEVVEHLLPGGKLRPFSRAANVGLGTLGGVLGPIATFFVLAKVFMSGTDLYEAASRGWIIPTATDIALAMLVVKALWGEKSGQYAYVVLLAILDDGIGLGLIITFLEDPAHPVHPEALWMVGVAMLGAYALRRLAPKQWWATITFCGGLSWYGMLSANMHAALALVPIVPFLPAMKRASAQVFDKEDIDDVGVERGGHDTHHAPLHNFEETLKTPVTYGLFIFAFANSGVVMSEIGVFTWVILGAIIIGKSVGITLFAVLADMIGIGLPEGLKRRDMPMVGLSAALALTVALFVVQATYGSNNPMLLGQAKMGALFSGVLILIALPKLLQYSARRWLKRHAPETAAEFEQRVQRPGSAMLVVPVRVNTDDDASKKA
ncbi:sodium:proton antiporter [Candidatus Peregrinibacteria bacterium CG11_big_fil_rev_8_21_14_0_20_46_8]|nr:MAG: sodium:proton antiporter [Candidatus Peregrinibacteria bacterium CG11_big_fil_rev_8_21_14_0_20_46_8]